MSDELRFSRLNASAAELAGEGFEPQRFVEQPVLLTGADAVLATENGHEMARCALLLLMRMTKSLTVVLPPGHDALASDLRAWADQHVWDEVPTIMCGPVDPAAFTAVLSVGGPPRPGHPWTVITSDGWSVRVTSGATPIDQDCRQSNPVGALAAASLGAGEVFKRLLRLRPDRGALLDGCAFSLWTYGSEVNPGPRLPTSLDVDLLVAGAGAIGNGVVHLLSRLPLRGQCTVLDRQNYGDENWGTCMRLSRGASKDPKADFLAGLFSGALLAKSLKADVEGLEADPTWRTPKIALNGFDNVEARHAIQDLWPDLVIDGAIGRRLECQVSAHPWPSPIACLRCIFKLPAGERAEDAQQRKTGLAPGALSNQTRLLTDDDIAEASPEYREWLVGHLGRPICSVLEAASRLSDADLPESFRPSVPFVATFSACMMVTELVRYLTVGLVGVEPRFFCSVLWGPHLGDHYPEDRHVDCRCVQRAANIDRARAARAALPQEPVGVVGPKE